MAKKILIVDDSVSIRKSVSFVLSNEGFEVIEAEDGLDGLKKSEANQCSLVITDINMPNMNGIETLKEIKKKKYNFKVLMLTVHNEVEYLLKAVDIGVDGYILKDSDSDELKSAIFSVNNGDNFIQPCLIPLLNSKMISRDNDKVKIESLTKRELEILILVSQGMFNKQIAEVCDIRERTVKNHISNIFKKIDVSDRTQAAVFAIRNNLIHI